MVFDKDWFKKHQRILLWLCNTPVIKIWFRYLLRINGTRSSIGNRDVETIYPNAIRWIEGYKGKKRIPIYGIEFRMDNKYSRRLYYSLLPLWYAFHVWDIILPQFDLGFSTLTQYPATNGVGDPLDGAVERSGVDQTFGNILAGAGTATNTGSQINMVVVGASATSNQFTRIARFLACYDTSAITSGNVVTSATISLCSNGGKANPLGDMGMNVVASTPGNTAAIANSDYGQTGSTSFASITYSGWSTVDGTYVDFTLDANGIANVSLTGISKFGFRASWDFNGSFGGVWASSAENNFNGYTSTQAGTTKDPKLVVIYSPPSTSGLDLTSKIW